jgi:hypothetical protein
MGDGAAAKGPPPSWGGTDVHVLQGRFRERAAELHAVDDLDGAKVSSPHESGQTGAGVADRPRVRTDFTRIG